MDTWFVSLFLCVKALLGIIEPNNDAASSLSSIEQSKRRVCVTEMDPTSFE